MKKPRTARRSQPRKKATRRTRGRGRAIAKWAAILIPAITALCYSVAHLEDRTAEFFHRVFRDEVKPAASLPAPPAPPAEPPAQGNESK